MRSLLVQGQFCLFVFYPECLWNLLKHFTSSSDRLQLHNEVVTFSKCLRETWDCRSDGGGGGGVSGGGQRRDEKLREWRYAASPHDEASKSEPDSPQASQKHSSSDVFHSGHWNMFDLLVLLQHRAVNQDQCWCFYIQREENMSVFTKLRWSQKKFFPPRLQWAGRNHWVGSLRTRTGKIRRICRAGSQREEEGECLFVIWVN